MPDCHYNLSRGRLKAPPRVALRRAWQKKKDPALRRTAFFVQLDITPAPEGGFLVEAAGAPPFALTEFEVRRWPAFRRRLENAIGCRVQSMPDAEWAWMIANRGLAPVTPAAEAWREADLEQFERDCEGWHAWMDDVGRVMAAERAEGRRA